MQSVPITTDVVSSNLDQGEVYNISLSVSCEGINKIVKVGYGFICLREEKLVLTIITLCRNCKLNVK
jgi:hypothetical protein